MIAQVILNKISNATDALYDYAIPDSIAGSVKIGTRVKVPFGNGNKTMEAFVYKLCETSELKQLKSIHSIIEEYSYFDENGIEMVEFMRHRYFCSYIAAIRTLIPAGTNMKFTKAVTLVVDRFDEIKQYCSHSVAADKIVSCLEAYGTLTLEQLTSKTGKSNVSQIVGRLAKKGFVTVKPKENQTVGDTYRTFVSLCTERSHAYEYIDAIAKTARARARTLEIICESNSIELSELLEYAATSKSTVDYLIHNGFAEYNKQISNDSALVIQNENYRKPKTLTDEQSEVYNCVLTAIQEQKKETFLLHGVTGSGKTEVYLNLIDAAIQMNKNAIFLVPEISLTPQMVHQVYARFGDIVAVLHSNLTVKQRYIEWKKIKDGDVKIAVGARSAIFAPFSNIGIIIIDEEHETTYKSEMTPRYNTSEIARLRAKQNNCVILLASATPSVENYYKAKNGTYTLLQLPHRINNAPLPQVEFADMRAEIENGNMSIFSNQLKAAIRDNLSAEKQTILFLNRRGFSGFVSCRNCGYVMRCPNCNVSLTYHKNINKMVCHYCDYKTDVKKVCPSCSGKHIRFFGVGTEKIVESLSQEFPEASVIRMDADTTAARASHEHLLKKFQEDAYDILVGTQMITKGLDFEKVTLVGVIAADMSLNVDDFRANERTFDLLTQVIGRAGRGQYVGKAIIQTYTPEDKTLIDSANQDYTAFYQDEIAVRKMLLFSPFSEFINFVFTSVNKDAAKKCADDFYGDILKIISETDFIQEHFKVCPAPLFRLNGKYRYHFLLKAPYKKRLYDALGVLYNNYKKNKDKVNISIDVNPNSLY